MSTTTKLTTAEELEAMPEDSYRYYLLGGELHRQMPTGFRHLKVAGTANALLHNHVSQHGLGVVGGEGGFVVRRDPDTVLAPDVAFVRTAHLPPEEEWDRFARVAPDLVVEVLSPSNTVEEIDDKIEAYLAAGVPLVWILDSSRRTVRVRRPDGTDFHLTEADYLDGGDVLPNFRVRVAEFFT